MINPYSSRKMITKADAFYGRQQELQQVYGQLQNAQSVSIIGPRRIGKSSLLYCLALPDIQKRAGAADYFPKTVFVYVDLLSKSTYTPAEFLSILLEEIYNARAPEVPEIPAEVTYRQFEQHIKTLCLREDYKIVFLLDEFDTITNNPQFNEAFFSHFRSLGNHYPISLVTASHKPLYELCHSEDVRSSPFFNIFQTVPLKLMSYKDAIQLIEFPAQQVNTSLENEKEWTLDLVGTHPFYIQICCAFLFEKKQIKSKLDGNDREAVTQSVLQQARGNFDHMLEQLNTEEAGFLKQLCAENALPASSSIAQQHLESLCLISLHDGYHRFFGRILKYYLDEKLQAAKSQFIDIKLWDGRKLNVQLVDKEIKVTRTSNNEAVYILPEEICSVTSGYSVDQTSYKMWSHTIVYGDHEEQVVGRFTRSIAYRDRQGKTGKLEPVEIKEISVSVK